MKVALMCLVPGVLVTTYYYSIGSVKEAEEYDRLSPEEAKERLEQLLPKMDLNGDSYISHYELKKWIMNSFM